MAAPHPLLLIGLDGATFDVLDPMFARGELPNLRALTRRGVRTELFSTVPPVTLPAWTALLCGANPGAHGIVDLLEPRGGYGLFPVDAGRRTLPTILGRLSDAGFSVASLGVPGTYPPEPLRGACVAGFDAPAASHAGPDAVWPPGLHAEIDRCGGWRYATFNEFRGDADPVRRARRVAEAILQDLAVKEGIIARLWRRRRWDLFFVHLQASDTAGHHLWHTFDEHSPRFVAAGDPLPAIYRRLDAIIGALCDSAPAHTRIAVVSDHGMGGAGDVAVHLNRWLHEHGWLRFQGEAHQRTRAVLGQALRSAVAAAPPWLTGAAMRALDAPAVSQVLRLAHGSPIDFARTQAFSFELDYAPAIWLQRLGVFPHGALAPGEADALAETIRARLLELRDPRSGARLIAAVHRRADVMSGPHVDRAPDLIVEPAWPHGRRPAFLTSPGPGPAVRPLSPHELHAPKGAGMPGVHRREGIFLAAGPGLEPGELPILTIEQAGVLLYALMGLAPPSDLPATVPTWATDLFPKPKVTPAWSKVGVSKASTAPSRSHGRVTQRLRELGYVD